MVGFIERLRHDVLYHTGKANVVEDDLSHMIMCMMSHVEEVKKDLVKDVHRLARLGVRLDDSPNGGSMVYNNSKSSLVVDVKSKQHLDILFMELKKLVLRKLNESFSLGGMGR